HPHPDVPEMRIVEESRELARELGVLDSSVFFNNSWVDYDDRQNYLMEADAGVSTHHSHIETTFSFRTRILDYLWAELPMVVTDGDHFAELVAGEKLGIVVPAGDVEKLAEALDRILFDTAFIAEAKANIHRVRQRYYWDVALAPLVDFVADAQHSKDQRGTSAGARATTVNTRRRKRHTGWRHDAGRALFYLKNGGAGVVIDKVRRRLRRS
ncbi:MAG: glycosyltransferase, partial [Terrimesophilobacter sp.]